MKKYIDLGFNYFACLDNVPTHLRKDTNELIRQEFYAAKEHLFGLGYKEYVEERALPLNPKNHHLFTPLATYRVKNAKGKFDWFNIYACALGGMLLTNEL